MNKKVAIAYLTTAVPGLDRLLGGGVPEFSFNIITGTPGSGKTTLAHQIMFSLANSDAKALFFTAMGEPPLKILRYQQQFSFFDVTKVQQSIQYVNLADEVASGKLDRVLARILDEVKDKMPRLVFVDTFSSLVRIAGRGDGHGFESQQFMLDLALQMTNWQATTFLIGESGRAEAESGALLTLADGIFWLSQNVRGNSVVRKIQIAKMRGQGHASGLHTMRINSNGVTIFPRAVVPVEADRLGGVDDVGINERLSSGVPELDHMLGGGLPLGYSVLVVGPSGSGKTVLATEFLVAGVNDGATGIIAAFEKSPNQLFSRKLREMMRAGQIGVINTRALDLSIDEVLYDLVTMITRMRAQRVVIDSLSGFELALASEFREDFRESLYRMISVLTGMGVSVLMTSELEDRYTDLRFSPYGSAFLADAIIVQRYVEIAGRFERVIAVVKLRGSAHSKDIRRYDIDADTIRIGPCLSQYEGILTGLPGIMPKGRRGHRRSGK